METLSTEDLKNIRDLAALFFSPLEIAIMLGLDEADMKRACRLPGNQVYAAYHGGRLQQEVKLRKSVIDIAIKGSSPAQTLSARYIDQVNAKLTER